MKRATKFNLTNRNSPFAGFTPKLLLSTGKSPFTNTEKSLIIEYKLFSIYQKEISPWGDSFPPWGDSFSPRGESFPLWGNWFSPRGVLFLPWGKWWLRHRKSFVMINKECLLRDKAFISGCKAIVCVRTLFRIRRVWPVEQRCQCYRGRIISNPCRDFKTHQVCGNWWVFRVLSVCKEQDDVNIL